MITVDDQKIDLLNKWIDTSSSTVFFGGAGVSTESGIPDFRSTDGLYNMKYKYPPEIIISHEFFYSETEEFYRFYREKLVAPDAKPNIAHIRLAELEAAGKVDAVITQNIDGLHQMAGSKNVFELHGCVHRNYCVRCGELFDSQHIMQTYGVPYCRCGGVIKPDVVLYNEELDDSVVRKAVNAIENAEMMIVGGTSLVVYPAAGLLQYFRGDKLVLINKSHTMIDDRCGIVFNEEIGSIFEKIKI